MFVIGPDKRIKATITYPMSTGRNFDEILRLLDSCQLTASKKVATPVNWKQGDDVIILPAVSDDDAKAAYPGGWKQPPAVHPHRAAARVGAPPSQGPAISPRAGRPGTVRRRRESRRPRVPGRWEIARTRDSFRRTSFHRAPAGHVGRAAAIRGCIGRPDTGGSVVQGRAEACVGVFLGAPAGGRGRCSRR